jgi:hypothetical protein
MCVAGFVCLIGVFCALINFLLILIHCQFSLFCRYVVAAPKDPDRGKRINSKWELGVEVCWGMYVAAFACLFGGFCALINFLDVCDSQPLLLFCRCVVAAPNPDRGKSPNSKWNWVFRYVVGCV